MRHWWGAYYLCRYIVGSKLGKLLVAIRDSEHRLRFIGYHITRYKLFVFVVASALAGLGGMLYVAADRHYHAGAHGCAGFD